MKARKNKFTYESDGKSYVIAKLHASYAGYDYTYIGKAKCSSDDEFDFNVGMKIARVRAELKYYTDCEKFIERVKSKLGSTLIELGDDMEKFKHLKSHDLEYLHKLIESL